jgi:large subunit ribosomal protein L4
MSTLTYTKSGTKATTPAKLDKAVFEAPITNHELVKQAYVAYLANGRTSAGTTKTRGLVRGGGRKPWKQKGTGRARFGSTRNPIWRGGGIVFGPSGNENYSHKLTTSTKRTAIRQALTMNIENIIVIETFECKNGKTSETVKFLDKINAKGNVLLVVSEKDNLVERATNNLSSVKPVQAMYLNVFDIMNADTIVISAKALELVHGWLGTVATPKVTTSKAPKANKSTKTTSKEAAK